MEAFVVVRTTLKADIIIIGGSIGGTIAALSAAKMNKKVIMTEETKWIGGQVTSQGVPPDEHQWIESFGCTATYREFRNRVREYYKQNYPLTEKARNQNRLNPGDGWVSRLCHEPKVALTVLQDMLAPYVSNGKIQLYTEMKAVHAESDGDFVQSVTVRNLVTGNETILLGHYFLDATECGDVLPLAGVEYVTGAESRAETGELHAPAEPSPMDMQPITYVMALDYIEGENFVIDKPESYDWWREYKAPFLEHQQLSWYAPDADTGGSKPFRMFNDEEGLGLWEYRRIIDPSLYQPGFYEGDISLINWPQNDYWLGSIIDVTEEERAKHIEGAKQVSLSLLYWLQTEAPRVDGGNGYPGLRLRSDVLGTSDGLAMYPYIRESRRIKAQFTVVEEHINADTRGDQGIQRYEDTIGIGCYRIDLHPTIVTNSFFYAKSLPFEIPLGSLLPIRVKNLLPACKNIGTTHITNGCYRVHPVEWNIGESAGYLASFAIDKGVLPTEIRENESLLREFQELLINQGIELHWPEIGAI
ncbi:FAD-dependent oxidoreductase [Bacillus sp. DJP31]|uniref:FAD-dependent oxidoreductase n=1 Tax=Bacillus sp. DJP31 TaxID=3409789 RepID=UPI003BB73809